jgi:phospholipid/cholesterol/gamma-HCH transport system substrate-binding protein
MMELNERNQARIGVLSIVLIVLVGVCSYFGDRLPLLSDSITYRSYFAESAGLESGNDVRIAGVKVGEVADVELDNGEAKVDFRVTDPQTWIGDRSSASIEVKTLLGEKYLSVQSKGTARLSPRGSIPVARTKSPYELNDALDHLSNTVSDIDTAQLAKSFRAVSNTFRNSPANVKSALDGLSSMSHSIASRQDQLKHLLANTRSFSKTIAGRDTQLTKLLRDGNLVLTEIQTRKQAIEALLKNTRSLATQLRGLVADNKEQLAPALDQLDQVTAVLARTQDNLSRGLKSMAPFIRVFNNTIGNGPWFEGYLCGLIPPEVHAGPVQTNEGGCQAPIAPQPGQGGR